MPPNLVAATLRHGLYTRVIGRRFLFFQALTSTMDEAARQAEAGAQEGTVVVAETQTAGRGRQGRSWVSSPGNLYLSVVLRPILRDLPFLSSLGGVAVARAIGETTGLRPRLKWPNDVLMEGRKVAGVLVESVVAGETVRRAVLGIGINVSLDPASVAEIGGFATSLDAAAGRPVPREELLRNVLQALDDLYLRLVQGQPPLAEWKGLLDTLGQRVQVSWGDRIYRGQAEDVDQQGNLQLRLEDGQMLSLPGGEVSLGSG